VAAPVRPPATTDAEIKRAVSINPDGIQEEYVQLPPTLHRWLTERTEAIKLVRLAELDLEVVEARVKGRARKDRLEEIEAAGKDAKLKPLTEDQTNDAMVLDDEYQAARRKVIEAGERKDRSQAMVDAVHAKREMLVSLGADLRLRFENDPSIRDRRPR